MTALKVTAAVVLAVGLTAIGVLAVFSESISAWALAHREILLYPFLVGVLFEHFYARTPKNIPTEIIVIVALVAALGFVALTFERSVPFSDVFLLLCIYSVTLYTSLCDLLRRGLAIWLTKRRGTKWIKELDYLYLAFGSVGILGSISRIEGVSGRLSTAEIFAPLLLATAVVIRLIKTRAEIAAWNKLPHKQSGKQRSSRRKDWGNVT